MKITFLGTNTLLFSKDQTTLLIDPHFTRPGLGHLLGKIRPDPENIAVNLARFGVRNVAGVLLTHTHYDHALDAVEVIRQAGGSLYGSASAVHLAQISDLDADALVQVTPSQAFYIGQFGVCFHPAKHVPFPPPLGWIMPVEGEITQALSPPAWFWNYQAGQTFAIQVEQTLVFGSAGFVTGAYQGLDIETVILGVGGLDLKSPRYIESLYRETVLAPGAKQVFLSHWDDFFRPVAQPLRQMRFSRRSLAQISALGAQYGQSVHQLEYGKSAQI